MTFAKKAGERSERPIERTNIWSRYSLGGDRRFKRGNGRKGSTIRSMSALRSIKRAGKAEIRSLCSPKKGKEYKMSFGVREHLFLNMFP